MPDSSLAADVVVEIAGIDSAEELAELTPYMRFENLHTANPTLIVYGRRYTGAFEDVVGTTLVVDTAPTANLRSDHDNGSSVIAATSRKLVFTPQTASRSSDGKHGTSKPPIDADALSEGGASSQPVDPTAEAAEEDNDSVAPTPMT
ncbi:hypothetical protein CAOG_04044 [Capsaspora owczarzaki ATCC 30864]|uniref:Transcription factor TFIIIC triple barrel domain-containing protein n=1 Tax=Capsaspora owczarzaki (strain ATCC 30864) TaxID=595528 RepID=A0A0D2WPE6_CAPO3|nr:hypothetical protein CAOG_04044 [Capsaspora owczarzaki ATCC 30864]KJE93225.1 hypothetical protein CAOG_004044 [Capsaspora owczarzaki ATCC 30864]|eukprot:XP_004347869.1 hypothetical protein CAOG_04044 [Capsaspora owczarzaki ATCC 30864]